MCSVFGYIAHPDRNVGLSLLRRMAQANVNRGPHAFGFAWVDDAGRLHCYKQQGRITDNLALLAMTQGARALVGHVRYATHGEPENNCNNHPHPCDGGWLVHNGVVHNHCDLVKDHGLIPVSRCDSETIALLLEHSPRKRLTARAAFAIEQCTGPLVVMALWRNRLLAARRGNPLHTQRAREGLLFSTLITGLPNPEKARALQDDTLIEYDLTRTTQGVPHATIQQITRHGSDHDALYTRRETGAYAGG